MKNFSRKLKPKLESIVSSGVGWELRTPLPHWNPKVFASGQTVATTLAPGVCKVLPVRMDLPLRARGGTLLRLSLPNSLACMGEKVGYLNFQPWEFFELDGELRNLELDGELWNLELDGGTLAWARMGEHNHNLGTWLRCERLLQTLWKLHLGANGWMLLLSDLQVRTEYPENFGPWAGLQL